jgi:glycerophosphoryl diester phosphodiesterase
MPVHTTSLIAHRGHVALFPENTMSSLRSAAQAGARFVEIDVQLLSDGVPVLFHDRTLERICGVPGSIHDVDSRRLAELNASEPKRFGDRFADEPLATLKAFATWLSSHRRIHAFVEIKPSSVERFGASRTVRSVLDLLKGMERQTTIISSNLEALSVAREEKDLPLGIVLKDWEGRMTPQAEKIAPETLFIRLDRIPEQTPLDREKASVAVYEIDDPEAARELVRRKARYVETFSYARMARALTAEGVR